MGHCEPALKSLLADASIGCSMRTCVGWPARSVRSLRYHGTVLYLADSAPNFSEPLLSRFAARAGFVTLRQRFVHRCHGIGRWATFSSGWVSELRRKALDRTSRWIVGIGLFRSSLEFGCPVDSCRSFYSVGQPTMSPCGASAA